MRYQVGDVVLDLTQRRVTRQHTEIELSELSFRLLAALVQAAPGWVSINELMARVWPTLVVGPETVVQRVKLVREALGDPARKPRYIGAARGLGYRIVAVVTPLPPVADARPVASPQPADTADDVRHSRWWRVAAVAAASVVVAGALLALLVNSAGESRDTRLAVLPFENFSPNRGDTSQRTPVPERLTRQPAAYDFYLRALTARNATAAHWHDPQARLTAVDELFSAAITADAGFAAAHAERAAVRMAMFVRNFDTSPELVRAIQSDVDAAERLAPAAAKTHAARAWYLAFVAGDLSGAASAFARAQAGGLADPMWMLDGARIFMKAGRYDDAEALLEHALAIDPANPVSTLYYADYLAAINRAHDALRVLEGALAKYPMDERLLGMRDRLSFASTGRMELSNAERTPRLFVGNEVAESAYHGLRLGGRLEDLHRLLSEAPSVTARSHFMGAGAEPVARYRGWVNLMRGDRAAAAEDGEAVLEFLESTQATEHNRYFRRLLAAEAHTFTGDEAAALAAARQSAALAARGCCNAQVRRTIAAVYAWSGAHVDAVDLLAELANETPGFPPAEIVRDPLFMMPLAANAGFAALVSRVEARLQRGHLADGQSSEVSPSAR